VSAPEYSQNKAWQFWCVWEGYSVDKVKFDDTGLEEFEAITYPEYRERLISTNITL
tara:strand:+ start:139 stop:306 length:168 start_codon:yes stop_codon:yes gene_type:complete